MIAKTGRPLGRCLSQSKYETQTSCSITYEHKTASVLTVFELTNHRNPVAPAGGMSDATGSSARPNSNRWAAVDDAFMTSLQRTRALAVDLQPPRRLNMSSAAAGRSFP